MGVLIAFLVIVVVVCGAIFWRMHVRSGQRVVIGNRTKSKMEPYLFILPVFVLLLVMFGYPLINSFIMAFQDYKLTGSGKAAFNGIENFKKLFDDTDTFMIVKNTLIYVLISVAGQFLLGMVLAMALKKQFRGRGLYQSIVFLPWAFSGFVIGLMFRWSFNGEYGVVNDILLNLGIIKESIAWLGTPGVSLAVIIMAMVWMGIPFFAIMILAALQSIPADVYEAADVDGCGAIRKYFQITLPYIKPTIITTILLRTIWIFNSFDLVVIITNGGPANTSQTLPAYMYSKAFGTYDFGFAAAIGVLLMVVLGIFAVIFLRATNYNKAGDF